MDEPWSGGDALGGSVGPQFDTNADGPICTVPSTSGGSIPISWAVPGDRTTITDGTDGAEARLEIRHPRRKSVDSF